MRLMRHNSRTALLLAAVLVAPWLGSAIASHWRESAATTQASAVPADSEDSRYLPPVFLPPTSIAPKPMAFEVFKVQSLKSVAELQSRLGADAFSAMLKINRIDRKHIHVGDLLVIPGVRVDLTSAAPFPLQLEVARDIPKLILVSRRVQAFGACESGRLVRWGPTSTGKKSTPTPAGLYHANWKAKKTRSSVNASWILPWCFNLDNLAGVSFHQFDLPGYPASHGCVRLLEEDAKWIYDWAEQWTLSKSDQSILAFGTPVLIFGDYTYSKKPVWTRLAEDAGATAVSIAEIETRLNPHLATIATRTRARQQPTTFQAATAAHFSPISQLRLTKILKLLCASSSSLCTRARPKLIKLLENFGRS
jgi:lipoprotein-anchoring transpeptidase ErfK/SrfK